MLIKIAGWTLLAVLVLYAVSDPSGAGAAVHHLFTSAATFLHSVSGH
jgi:hypothetical protein